MNYPTKKEINKRVKEIKEQLEIYEEKRRQYSNMIINLEQEKKILSDILEHIIK